MIHELTQGMTLKAGTIMLPAPRQVWAWAWTRRSFWKPGDTVRCEIDGIGSLTNTVR